MFCYRVFRQGGDTLLAICDSSILERTFEQGGLSITVSPEFYSEKECGRGDVKKLAARATIINAVGNDIVDALISEKIVKESGVIKIGGVKHAQVVAML